MTMETDSPLGAASLLPDVRKWLPLLHEALAREGRFRWQLRGSSMVPTLLPGWIIEVVPLQGPPALGSLIVFAQGSALVAHRLVFKSASYWVTQGDHRLLPDPRVAPEEVVGLVRAAYHGPIPAWPDRNRRLKGWFWTGRAWSLAGQRRLRRIAGMTGPSRMRAINCLFGETHGKIAGACGNDPRD